LSPSKTPYPVGTLVFEQTLQGSGMKAL